VKFGIFDHLDRKDQPLARFYADRLKFVAAADKLGITSYHCAEHHCAPAGMAPQPGVWLSAVAQRTKKIRFGPMAYGLTFHEPLILAEEICMLDHLSGGRFDLGVGRGVSPWEAMLFNIRAPESKYIFHEAMQVILQCFTQDRLTHKGDRFKYYDVPMEMRPLQKPYPPLWYPTSHPGSREYAAKHAMHLVAGWAPNARVKQILDLYMEAWEKNADAPLRLLQPNLKPYLGSVRQIVVADTDAEANKLAKFARDGWFDRLEHLPQTYGFTGVFVQPEYEDARQGGSIISGTPATVRELMEKHIAESGVNYVLVQLAFGNISHAEEMRSLELFATEVMPHFVEKPAAPSKPRRPARRAPAPESPALHAAPERR
jgi:alkanesulfonate monooxygenase SsuD/methylene tetrahydromethanopterin reductase-like flavin-dependent oxidoreductase (luciferase family)